MNKPELLTNIRSGRAQLEASLAPLSDEQLMAPALHGNWSVKDLIAHFGFWEQRIVTLYGKLSHGEAPAADEPQLDELNAQAYAANRDKTLSEVRRIEREAYEQLLALTESASEDDLFDPQRFAWTEGRPFAEEIEGNTYGHYEQHSADLEASK